MRRSALPLFLVAILWLLPGGCGERGRPALHQALEGERAQAVYGRYARVLDDACSIELPWLVEDPRRVVLFRLVGTAAGGCAVLAPGESPWHDGVVLFLVAEVAEAEHGPAGHAGVWLFDPRHEHLEAVAPPGAATTVTVYRSLSVAPLPKVDDRLCVHAHRFAIAADGAIAHLDGCRLSDGPGNDLLPVALPGAGVLVFQREEPGLPPRLLRLDLAGAAGAAPVVIGDSGEGRSLPLRLDAESVACVVGTGHRARLRRLEPTSGVESALDTATVAFGMPGRLLVLEGEAGGLRPRLLQVPARIGVEQAMALARCRSAAVARQRALLAASLAEARRERLSLWPSLQVGVVANPLIGIATDAAGAGSGDILGEGLVRLLAGLVQPLLTRERQGALEAAAMERARIAADLAELEAGRAAVAAARLAGAWRRHETRLGILEVAARQAEEHLARLRRRHETGEATDAEILVGEAASLAAVQRLRLGRLERAAARQALLRLLGLHPDTELAVEDSTWDLTALADRPLAELHRLAALRQPGLLAAAREAEVAFLVARVDRRQAPSLTASAFYGYTVDAEDGSAVDDYLQLGLNGQLPLAAGGDARVSLARATAIRMARQAELALQRQEVAEAVDRLWSELQHALADQQVAASQLAAAEEELRVARLRSDEDLADAVTPTGLHRLQLVVVERHLAYWDHRAAAEGSALELLGLIGSQRVLDDTEATAGLVRPLRIRTCRIVPPSAAGVRALGPLVSGQRRILQVDVDELFAAGTGPLELERLILAAGPEDRVVLVAGERPVALDVARRFAAGHASALGVAAIDLEVREAREAPQGHPQRAQAVAWRAATVGDVAEETREKAPP